MPTVDELAEQDNTIEIELSDAIADKPRTFVSFYPDAEAQGGALREVLVLDMPPNDGRLINIARNRAKRLKAKSWVCYIAVPRIWVVNANDYYEH